MTLVALLCFPYGPDIALIKAAETVDEDVDWKYQRWNPTTLGSREQLWTDGMNWGIQGMLLGKRFSNWTTCTSLMEQTILPACRRAVPRKTLCQAPSAWGTRTYSRLPSLRSFRAGTARLCQECLVSQDQQIRVTAGSTQGWWTRFCLLKRANRCRKNTDDWPIT